MVPVRSLASLAFLVTVASLGSIGCVSKVNFDRVVADASKAQSDADAKQKEDNAPRGLTVQECRTQSARIDYAQYEAPEQD